ncbi:alcohol dehydrogenase [Polychaeton citri CBS 116435]|uniref:Alcohol dehydrogenase n=1 Tax=Polychaeton citri CBS 116435 TaxID=1314669 RepID=A0A9P4QGQ1_9PEZI|nr:alcohol dehydrogenase [Polychaeton citri CBS 116435]
MAANTQQVRAWTYTHSGYPQSLQFSTVSAPTLEDVNPNHILVKIHAAALNPVDIQMMNLPIWSIPVHTFNGPKVSSSDFSGTVLAAGQRTGFKQGDEVFGVTMSPFKECGGTLSEIAHLDLANTTVAKKPKGWSFEQAAGLGIVWLTARTCVELCAPYVDPTPSKKIAMLGGSSAAGIYTIMIAKQRGWKVITTCSGRNADFVTQTLGADEVVDYTKENVRSNLTAFKPDAVIDCVGGVEAIGLSKRYVTIVGDKTSRTSMGGSFTYLYSPRQWLRWAFGRLGLCERYDCIVLDQNREYLEEATKLGPDQIFIDSTFAFEDAKQAFERLNTGRARGKVIVQVAV